MIWKSIGNTLEKVTKNDIFVHSVELLAGLSVIVTVVVMWIIYIGQRDDAKALARKQLAVEMLTLSHNENIVNAQAEVTRFLLAHARKVHQAAAGHENPGSVPAPLDNSAKTAFLTMTQYYDELLKCRESGECDAGMIDLWFRDDICGFAEFAQLTAYPAMVDDYGVNLGERLVRYKQSECPRKRS